MAIQLASNQPMAIEVHPACGDTQSAEIISELDLMCLPSGYEYRDTIFKQGFE